MIPQNRTAWATFGGRVLASVVLVATIRPGAVAALDSPGHSRSSRAAEEKPLRRVELLLIENRSTSVTVGLRVELAPGWYLYWLNPGDAGLAPEVIWQLPPGFEAGRLRFPTPQKIVHGDIVTYGFTDETLILCDIRRPATSPAENKPLITAVLDWMACRESCLTGETQVELSLSALSPTETQRSRSIFSRFSTRYPESLSPTEIAASGARLIKSPGRWTLEIPLSGRDAARVSDFYPFPLDDFVIDHHRITISGDKLIIPVNPSNPSAILAKLSGLVIIDGAGFEVSIPVKD